MTGLRQLAVRLGPSALLLGAGVVAWQAYAVQGDVGDDVLPPPTRVVSAGWADRQALWDSFGPTLREVVLGFALSIAFAFAVSVVLDRSAFARRAVIPVLIGSQTLPIIILAPLVVIWFGFGLTPKVLLVALVTFFPLVIGLVEGYASSEPDAVTLLETMGAGWLTTFRLVRLPSALPSFFTSLRISITYAVVAAIFAEYAGAEAGLGVYMQGAKGSFRTDLVLAAVLVSTALTLVLYALTFVVQRMMIPWYTASRKGPV